MGMQRRIAIICGDMRQVYLAQMLLEEGQDVVTWGLEKGDGPRPVPLHMALEAEILVLPLLVMAALNLFQMTLSLFIKPFYSYIVTAAILLISAYYVSPFCIGNYAMPLRSHMIMANGVGLNTGMLVSVIILVVAVIVGGLVFQRRDILKGEG